MLSSFQYSFVNAFEFVESHRSRSDYLRAFCTRSLFLYIVKRLLSLPVIPIESTRDAVDPVFAAAVQGQDAGEGESAG